MPQFVLLWHETSAAFARPSHWDLMLEAGDHLRCWALERAPDEVAEQTVDALPGHRLAYLDYEGPVSGQRGSVSRHDVGEYEIIADEANKLIVLLRGHRLLGTLTLRLESAADQRWQLSWAPA